MLHAEENGLDIISKLSVRERKAAKALGWQALCDFADKLRGEILEADVDRLGARSCHGRARGERRECVDDVGRIRVVLMS